MFSLSHSLYLTTKVYSETRARTEIPDARARADGTVELPYALMLQLKEHSLICLLLIYYLGFID